MVLKLHTVALLVAATGLTLAPLPPVLADTTPTPITEASSNAAVVQATSPEAHPDTTFDKERFQREVVKSKDLPNFHEVHPFLFRGGEPTEAGLMQLRERGIGTVIDLRGGDKSKHEGGFVRGLGMKYINLPMSSEPPTPAQVKTFLKTVKEAQAHPKNGNVFVHCAHGSDRAGCMIGIWRVTQDGWSYEEAYKEMRHYWFTPKFTKLSGSVKKYAEGMTQPRRQTATQTQPGW